MYLYLYHSDNRDKQQKGKEQETRADFSDRLVRKTLREYCKNQQLSISDEELWESIIERDGKGKPYFAGLSDEGLQGRPPIHFSVSHSGSWWGCLMAEESVGFDMEVPRENVNYNKIARRFFTKEEWEWILITGLDAFYDVWVRKEAYVKYLGSGLAEGLDSFSVIEYGKLSTQVISRKCDGRNHLPCFIRPCEIPDGVKAAYCSTSGNPIKAMLSLE